MKSLANWTVMGSIVVAAGCAGAAASEWEGSVTDSAGVSIVANTDRGLWPEGDGWTLVEELKIGSLDDENYQFGQIGFIAVGSDEAIYVLDAQAQLIQVYDRDGSHLRSMGGPGSGPGELGLGTSFILMGPGDTLMVPDLQNRRINLYDAGGESIGSAPLDLAKGIPMAWRGTSSGTVARQSRPIGPDAPAEPTDVIEALNMDGSPRDTLMQFASGGTFNFSGGSPELKIFAAEPIWTINDAQAVFYGVNDDYRISKYSGGDLTHIFSKPFARRPVTDGDQELLLDAIVGMTRNAGAPPAQLQGLRQIIQFGETFPAFANLQVGPEGSLWVQHVRDFTTLSAAERENINFFEDAGADDWDVFDADGRFLGVVTMPDRFAPRLLAGNLVYGVWRDDLDVQYVVRLRIVMGGGIAD